MQPRHQATLTQPLQRDIEIWQNTIERNGTVRSATTGAKTPSNYAHMNNRFSPTPAPCNIHAAITMRFATMAPKAPFNCEGQKHAKHIEPAPALRTAPSPARTHRTQDVPSIAGYSHFTRKNARFRAPAFSPTQAPCNIHAAITMCFATKFRKHHVIAKRRNRFPRKNTRFRGPASSPTQAPCNIHAAINYIAFCNTTRTFMQPLRCHFPKSPFSWVNTSLNHHFQQSPHSLRHHFPSSPLPSHHFPRSTLP